jgi:RNA polymerase sigma-70 factor, ECF subfamily
LEENEVGFLLSDNSSNIIDFTLVYNRHKRELYNYVYKMLNEKFTAEDITHNVFLKLYENLAKIKKTQSVTAWLYVTARNEVYMHLRKKKIKKENYIDEGDEFKSSENLIKNMEEVELKELLSNEINCLDEELKEVFLLREYSELSYKEIAEVVSIEESQVKGRLFRARQKLIEKIIKII